MANPFQHVSIGAVKVLARLAAKKAVQAELKAQGVRVTLFPHAELMRQAAEYLASHPELYVAAHERAQRMTAEGVFGKRAQRAYLKLRLCRTHAQNDGAVTQSRRCNLLRSNRTTDLRTR